MGTFIKDVIRSHNDRRQNHGAPSLKHNPELTELAQSWADHLATTKSLQHSDHRYKGSQLGENCASRWSSAPGGADYTGEQVVEQWYKEVDKHDFVKNDYNPGTCHFSQVVWTGSHEIGVGKARTTDGRCFVVCNYYPPGNVMGKFQDNIGKPKGGSQKPTVSAKTPAQVREPNAQARKTCSVDMVPLLCATKHSLSLDSFIQDVVSAHNSRRQKHGATGLKHNADLTELAQTWADHLATTKVLQHSNHSHRGRQLGENCASRWSSAGADYTGNEVVEQWYKEIAKHDFVKNDYNPGTCHFSQVVWKDSQEIGVGKSKTDDGRCYVVCNYYPPGNVIGHFQENIGKLKK